MAGPKKTDEIEENLKRVYQEALDEELPDRFKLLLERLRTEGPDAVAKTQDDT